MFTSLLDNLQKRQADSAGLPFHWAQAYPAITDADYAQLAADFPGIGQADAPQEREGQPHQDYWRLRPDDKLPDSWRAFWDYANGGLCQELLDLFRPEINLWYPTLLDNSAKLRMDGQYAWRVYRDDAGLAPHCDSPTALFILLWYFREPEDLHAGGDLRLLAPAAGGLRTLATCAYQPNHLVVLFNTPTAIHELTPRYAVTVRRHVRIIFSVSKGQDLFPALRLRDCPDGRPAPGVGVSLYGPDAPLSATAREDALRRGRQLVKSVQTRSLYA